MNLNLYRAVMATSVKPKICENGDVVGYLDKVSRGEGRLSLCAPGPYSHPQNGKPDKCETRMKIWSLGKFTKIFLVLTFLPASGA